MKCSGSGRIVNLEDGRDCPVCGRKDIVILTCIIEEGAVQEHDRVMKRKKGRRKK